MSGTIKRLWAAIFVAAACAAALSTWAAMLAGGGQPEPRVGCCTRVDILEYHIREAVELLDKGEAEKARTLLVAQLEE